MSEKKKIKKSRQSFSEAVLVTGGELLTFTGNNVWQFEESAEEAEL